MKTICLLVLVLCLLAALAPAFEFGPYGRIASIVPGSITDGASTLFMDASFISIGNTAGNEMDIDITNPAITMIDGDGSSIVLSPLGIRQPMLDAPPLACAVSSEGYMYSDTSHAICWCDGTTWTKLAGAGTCS